MNVPFEWKKCCHIWFLIRWVIMLIIMKFGRFLFTTIYNFIYFGVWVYKIVSVTYRDQDAISFYICWTCWKMIEMISSDQMFWKYFHPYVSENKQPGEKQGFSTIHNVLLRGLAIFNLHLWINDFSSVSDNSDKNKTMKSYTKIVIYASSWDMGLFH